MKRIMTLAALFAAVTLTFSACEQQNPENEGENNGENVTPGPGNQGNTGTTPEEELAPEVKDGDLILVTNPSVNKFLTDVEYPDHDYSFSNLKSWSEENGISVSPGLKSEDKPQVYTIRWEANETDGEITAKLWEETWSREYTLAAGKTYLEISNLCPNTHYNYEVKAGEKVLTQGEFDTEGRIRQLFFNFKIRNLRDLGGWKTTDGKTIKYRKVYRGGRFLTEYLTNSGKNDVKAEGIKAQLDLRGTADVLSPEECTLIGIVDDYEFCAPVIEEGYIWLLRDEPQKAKECLQFIMDCVKKDKPVIFHCSLGRDRTGTIAMMVLGLLGVPEGDISLEYEVTQFAPFGYATSNGETTKMNRMVDYELAANYIWDNYVEEGESFADGVEKYLLEIGISQEDIDTFRENMLK